MKGMPRTLPTSLCILLLALCGPAVCAAAGSEWVEFGGPKHRGKDLTLQARVQVPEGSGPFPAVVLLHGCKGMSEDSEGVWAKRFNDLGYVTLMLESYRPRGYLESCDLNVTPGDRARDVHAARRWLAGQSYVDAKRIGLFGLSKGGWGVMTAIDAGNFPDAEPFAAAVVLYPWCPSYIGVLSVPLLAFIGGQDDWAPPKKCREMTINNQADTGFTLKEYPQATHYYDAADLELMKYKGYVIRHDAAATSDTIQQVKAFLQQHLR